MKEGRRGFGRTRIAEAGRESETGKGAGVGHRFTSGGVERIPADPSSDPALANHGMISDERAAIRLRMYRRPGSADVGPRILAMIPKRDDFLIPLEKIRAETLFLWTDDNPVHDLETARASVKRVRGAELYVMKAKSAHGPQYEAPDEFNAVARRFFATGKV